MHLNAKIHTDTPDKYINIHYFLKSSDPITINNLGAYNKGKEKAPFIESLLLARQYANKFMYVISNARNKCGR